MKLILGSQSPRRRDLLAQIAIPFTAVSIDADESFPPTLMGGDIPLYIARSKAQAFVQQLQPDELLITSDTIVWLDGHMLGKPKDEHDAIQMLHTLSGQTHQVFTAVVFLENTDGQWVERQSLVDKTDVTFRSLSDDEIQYYVHHYRPMDKAGSYGVQEYIGYIGVERINGSYFNVMGFPIDRVYAVLKSFGLAAPLSE